jgi:NhaP-type Na+/H+ or K+/H+ antiporter
MLFCRFTGVVLGKVMMTLRDMRMVTRFLMRSSFVLLGCFFVVFRCVFMMFSGFLVMLRAFMLGHKNNPPGKLPVHYNAVLPTLRTFNSGR